MNGREMFLKGIPGSAYHLDFLSAETVARLRAEREALNCSYCDDEACAFRFKQDRLPEDVGGKSQCLRWAQEFTPLAWRNQDGRVIIMPQEIIDKLKSIL